ncbi:MAG: CAP domain-containing protein [Acidimicrobiia bacterium]
MRRAVALATATAAWVVVIQLMSGATAPPRVVELPPADVSRAPIPGRPTSNAPSLGGTLELSVIPGLPVFAVPAPDLSATVTTLQGAGGGAPSATTTSAAPASPFTTAVTTTTTAPVSTTTVPPATTTTTVVPATTTTTTTAPATTTTATPTTTTAPPPVGGDFSPAAESDFASRINNLRSSVGVAGLGANAELNNYARWWAKQMAQSGDFAHSNIASLLGPWSVVGENIGYGQSVSSIFNALVNSPGHYNNMVDSRFNSIGVGVFVDASGRIWTAHVFGG